MKKTALALLGFAAVLPLSGCISLSPKPPARLMVLTATTPLAPGTLISTGDAKAVKRLMAIAQMSSVSARPAVS